MLLAYDVSPSGLSLQLTLNLIFINKGKGKVVPVLLLNDHHAMEPYWGVDV